MQQQKVGVVYSFILFYYSLSHAVDLVFIEYLNIKSVVKSRDIHVKDPFKGARTSGNNETAFVGVKQKTTLTSRGCKCLSVYLIKEKLD